jgi:hypothetical protein
VASSGVRAEVRHMLSDRTMFEIYREAGYGRQYRVVYFTELGERDRETEIGRALAGEHIFDGFIRDLHKEPAKRVIAAFVDGLNRGRRPDVDALRRELEPFAG